MLRLTFRPLYTRWKFLWYSLDGWGAVLLWVWCQLALTVHATQLSLESLQKKKVADPVVLPVLFHHISGPAVVARQPALFGFTRINNREISRCHVLSF
jgi:hypothetical protein